MDKYLSTIKKSPQEISKSSVKNTRLDSEKKTFYILQKI